MFINVQTKMKVLSCKAKDVNLVKPWTAGTAFPHNALVNDCDSMPAFDFAR